MKWKHFDFPLRVGLCPSWLARPSPHAQGPASAKGGSWFEMGNPCQGSPSKVIT